MASMAGVGRAAGGTGRGGPGASEKRRAAWESGGPPGVSQERSRRVSFVWQVPEGGQVR